MSHAESKSMLPSLLFVGGFCAMGVVAIVFSGVFDKTTGSPWPMSCTTKLRQIGLALQCYYETYGSFPPAVVRNSEGRPMHSWRVLLLPYIDDTGLDRQYDYSQPWDSPHNLKCAEKVPWFYRCPGVAEGDGGKTPFLAVVGKDAAWAPSGSRRKEDFPDGLKNTVLVLSMPARAVVWTQPEDIAFPFDHVTCSSTVQKEPCVINCLFADGSVGGIQAHSLCDEGLRPIFTRATHDEVHAGLLTVPAEHLDFDSGEVDVR